MPAIAIGVMHVKSVYFTLTVRFFRLTASDANFAVERCTTCIAAQLPSDLILPWTAIESHIIAAWLEAHISFFSIAIVEGVRLSIDSELISVPAITIRVAHIQSVDVAIALNVVLRVLN